MAGVLLKTVLSTLLRGGAKVASSGFGRTVAKVASNKAVRFIAPIAAAEGGSRLLKKVTG